MMLKPVLILLARFILILCGLRLFVIAMNSGQSPELIGCLAIFFIGLAFVDIIFKHTPMPKDNEQ